jgi:hypothetical protein
VAEVVFTVASATAGKTPFKASEVGTEQVGKLAGLAIVVLTAQERFTWPVRPSNGMTETYVVLPVELPGATFNDPSFMTARDGEGDAVTETCTVVVA